MHKTSIVSMNYEYFENQTMNDLVSVTSWDLTKKYEVVKLNLNAKNQHA